MEPPHLWRTAADNSLSLLASCVRSVQGSHPSHPPPSHGWSQVVYRGYHASDKLQRMHDSAIEARTSLRLEADTEEQSQTLADLKLHKEIERADKRREMERTQKEHQQRLEQMEHSQVRVCVCVCVCVCILLAPPPLPPSCTESRH